MSTEGEKSDLEFRDEFLDDELSDNDNINLSNLTSFRVENYQLSHLTLEPQTSTPANSFTEVGSVKRLAAIYESTETNSSTIADRTRAKGKMGSKLVRFKKVFEKFEVEIQKRLEDMERALETEDMVKVEDLESELQAHKTTLQGDIERISSEVCDMKDLDDVVDLEHRAKMLLVKITKACGNANKVTSRAKSKQTPVSAGKVEKLDLPEFEGDCTKYKFFRTRFKVLTACFDEVTTKIYLTEKLKGRAYQYVKDLVLQDASLKRIWKALDDHYGNEQNIIDATVKAYFDLQTPIKDINKFEDFFVQSKNLAASVIELGHDPEELLAAYFMLQIPGEYRSEIEKKLSINRAREESTSTRYKFSDLSPLVDEFVRIMKMSSQNDKEQSKKENQNTTTVKAMLGAAHNIQEENGPSQVQNLQLWDTEEIRGNQQINSFMAQTDRQYNRGRGYNEGFSRGRSYYDGQGRGYNERYNQNRGRGNDLGYSRGSYSRGNASYPRTSNYFCQLCSKQHWTNRCDSVKNGPEMRSKLKSLNRCDACLTEKDRHGAKCTEILSPCIYCRSSDHQSITCDGNKHPGSWLLS